MARCRDTELTLRQFKALGTARRQLGAEREPFRVIAVEHRRERIRAILQTRPQGYLCSRQLQPLGAALSQHGSGAPSRLRFLGYVNCQAAGKLMKVYPLTA